MPPSAFAGRYFSSLLGATQPLPIVLANVDTGQAEVSQYLASEKLDGVRAFWDGRVLRFRSGKPIKAPPWFLAGLPKVALDGELWIGRGQFERLSGIVRRAESSDDDWRDIRYMLFELPGAAGSFAERLARLQQLVAEAKVEWLHVIPQFTPANREELRKQLDLIVRQGGEGLMLHLAAAPYQAGRSDVLLKVKPWQDAEAVVIDHLPGRGRFAGMLGALRVRTPDGRVFSLGSGLTEAERRTPPPVGTTVTYRFHDLTESGLPRFASFLRIHDEQ